MTPFECPYEAEALSAGPEIRAHVASCPVCSEIVAVASAIDAARGELYASAVLPDAGRVWRQAQLRARLEAAEKANLPLSAAQAIAFACAVGLLGACFGASSSWFQGALRSAVSGFPGFDPATLLTFSVLGIVLMLFLVPTALFVAFAKD